MRNILIHLFDYTIATAAVLLCVGCVTELRRR